MYEWLFAGVIVLVASVLQSAVGFGFAIVGTPLLLLVFDSRDVIQISNFLSLSIAILLLPKIIKEVDLLLLKRLFIGSLFGVPMGLLFFAYVSLDIIVITVGIVVIAIGLFLLVVWLKNRNFDQQQQQNSTGAPTGKRQEIMIGLLSSITTGIGMPGIPLSIYFNIKNTKKEVVRSTTLAFFIVVYVITIISQLLTVKIGFNVMITSLLLLPALITGVLVGNLLYYRINQRMFQLIINLILICTGVYMLINSI